MISPKSANSMLAFHAPISMVEIYAVANEYLDQ